MEYGSGASAYQPPLPDPAALAALRSALVNDREALDRIAMLPPDEAIDALCGFAGRWGIGLAHDALADALRSISQGDGGIAETRLSPLWLPARLVADGPQMLVEWAHFGTAPFDAPFFAVHLRRARSHPVSRLYLWRTPLEALEHAASEAGRGFDGLVFHMSRCGSTMVSQALAAMPGHVALSEPAPFDQLLQFCAARTDLALEYRLALLRGMAALLTGERGGVVRRRFLKTDCWHAGALPLLRAAFPDTPWIFLYRDPCAVLRSHERMPGWQSVPGPHAAMVGIDEPGALPGLEFTARVLAATCHMAADHAGLGGGLFVDYAELPEAFVTRILPHFGITPNAAERQAIAAALARDAKEPYKPFDPNKHAAPEGASAEVLAASERHLAPAVARLRAIGPHIAD